MSHNQYDVPREREIGIPSWFKQRNERTWRMIDQKILRLRNGCSESASWQIQGVMADKRAPHDAIDVIQTCLDRCHALAVAAQGDAVRGSLQGNIARSCEDELDCLHQGLTFRRPRYWSIQSDVRRLEGLARVPHILRPHVKHTLDGTEGAEAASIETDSTDREGHDSQSASSDGTDPEKTQMDQRLEFAMRYKGIVNLDQAKRRYLRAMEEQEWERSHHLPLWKQGERYKRLSADLGDESRAVVAFLFS